MAEGPALANRKIIFTRGVISKKRELESQIVKGSAVSSLAARELWQKKASFGRHKLAVGELACLEIG